MPRTATQWSFTYQDISDITGRDYNTIIQDRIRGHFDPEVLSSVAIYIWRWANRDLRYKLIELLATNFYEPTIGTNVKSRKKAKKKPGV